MRRGPIRFGEVCLRANRELDSPIDSLSVAIKESGVAARLELAEKFPRDVIQTGPQIGDEIPNYAREARWRLGLDDTFNMYDMSFQLGDDFAGLCVYVPRAVFVERCQVLLSPDDFEPSAV